MASLIVTHPKSEFTGTIRVSIDNWRAFGMYSESILHLITSNFSSYLIHDLTFKKFLEVVKLGFDLPVKGTYESEALVCKKCLGHGATDWVSKIVGRHPSSYKNSIFTIDKKLPMYALHIPIKNSPNFTLYFNRAKIGEHLELCPSCGGTGLFMFSAELESILINEIPTHKF